MVVHMFRGIENQTAAEAVPLQSAVLCIDCESVSDSRCDECPVCGSRSVLSLARLLGGTLAHAVNGSTKTENVMRFDLEVIIALKKMETRDLNAAIQGIIEVIGPILGQDRASFHINVEPVAESSTEYERKAA
jgi:hypothetical protein